MGKTAARMRGPAAGADKMAMPTLFIGLLALALVLWLLKSAARV